VFIDRFIRVLKLWQKYIFLCECLCFCVLLILDILHNNANQGLKSNSRFFKTSLKVQLVWPNGILPAVSSHLAMKYFNPDSSPKKHIFAFMDNDTLYIKNMVCPRCIQSVQRIITEAELDLVHIELGKVVVYNKVSREQLSEIDKQLKDSGFELLQDKTQKTIEEIKTEIINMIHYEKKIDGHVNISNHLSKKTGCDYSYLSNLFSSVEGITIEKYLIRQKIERAKELLVYDELSLKEISWDLGYSSVQHLSTQFRKITGLSPSQFKKLRSIERKPLDQV